jgi:sulfite exporter TauE/SafE
MYWLAFTTGFLGSLHCMGMCGPIALSLSFGNSGNRWQFYSSRLQYNFGRIFSYTVLGLIMGLPGQMFQAAVWQQKLSIVAGTLLLLSFFSMLGSQRFDFINMFNARISSLMSAAMTKTGSFQMLMTGILNGLLPCGLVYVAFAGALASGGASNGALYMALFGIGTLPMMVVMSAGGVWFPAGFRAKLRKVLPATTFLVGILLVLRGMNLGIPYLSPQLEEQNDKAAIECCEMK